MSATAIKLVVGLGNPGDRYSKTRHNAGFWFVDRLAAREGETWVQDKKQHCQICKLGDVRLMKPDSFMNLSGQSVGQVARYYSIPVDAILVAYDELDLEPGVIRLKHGGGHGGHNGMRDIFAHLGDRAFWRLRIGIGHPGHASAVSNYVLSRPGASDQKAIELALDRVEQEWSKLKSGEFEAVMRSLHSRST